MQRIGENWLSQSSKNRIEPSTNPSFAEGVFAKATVDQGASPAILVGRLGKHLQRREQVGVLAFGIVVAAVTIAGGPLRCSRDPSTEGACGYRDADKK